MPRPLVVAAAVVAACLAACSSSQNAGSPSTPSSSAPSTIATAERPLRVLVTNDDGVTAPGIDALVEALRRLPDTTVTVVAPAKNQSGTGGKTTSGTPPSITDATTASGYGAKAVAGYPADTIVWAIDRHGIADRPDVVLSGVNFGQNIGSAVDVSGTVGAARAAAQRGISTLAVSAGIAKNPAYALAAQQAVAWLTAHRNALRQGVAPASVTNMNVPTCPSGSPRKVVRVPVAGTDENPFAEVDCVGAAPEPTTDVNGFVHGYIVETDNLSLQPAS